MKISVETHQAALRLFGEMEQKRRQHWAMWRQLASVYLPYTLPFLLDQTKNEVVQLNPNYLTSIGLLALRTQTAGLMNGITSPTRPWFKLTLGRDDSRLSITTRRWLHQSTHVMYDVLANSNFYNTMATHFFDIGLFGTAGVQTYEDYEDVIRFQRQCPGEFFVAYDYLDRIKASGRYVRMPLHEIRSRFGEANLPDQWRQQLRNPKSLTTMYRVKHLIFRDDCPIEIRGPASRFQWRELYLADVAPHGEALSVAGYHERAGVFPRWGAELELGTSPSMDALQDMLELQQIILKKGVGLEKIIDPPMLMDATMAGRPVSMLPGSSSYVPDLAAATGARPAYVPQIPFAELRSDIDSLKLSVRELHHNDLFKMMSQLDTVRSATEIDARREEKLVLLSHFLERFENEALSPLIKRTFAVCQRAGLFPDPPQELLGQEPDIIYSSILSTVQKAVGAVPLERLLAMTGQVASVEPSVLDIIDFDEFVYAYGRDIGSSPLVMRDAEGLRKRRAAREAQLAQVEATATAATAIDAARSLSETDVGGGANALQRLLS